jgi:nucleoside-diphosphate-sugar epimerase
MSLAERTVLVTGISGNLGTRLLPFLTDFRVVGVDLRPPDASLPVEFHQLDLGRESSCQALTRLLRETGTGCVIHLAGIVDPIQSGIVDPERMWQINVAGTARVMEAISVVNRTGGKVAKFIYPSSVLAYGSETPGAVKEEAPLNAHTLPFAVQKREGDEVVRYRAESMGECCSYVLRAHIYAGSSMQNYIIGALRGTALGKSKRAARMRAEGKRLPVMLPRGQQYLKHSLQFVHVDDVARVITYLLYRPNTDPLVTILNVAGRGGSLTVEQCLAIAQARLRVVPTRAAFQVALKFLWKAGVSSIPPEAAPYLLGSYTMDTTRLERMLGDDYPRVIQYTVEDALRDSFAQPAHT